MRSPLVVSHTGWYVYWTTEVEKQNTGTESPKTILGLRCSLDEEFGEVVRKVLRQIQRRSPRDFQRLCEAVRDIVPLTGHEEADGTLGEFTRCPVPENIADDRAQWDKWNDCWPHPGVVKVSTHAEFLAGVLAHEFGHACTRWEDLERRRAPTDEWASELAADWYAYKWGFGRLIAREKKTRDLLHHGPCPGETCELEKPDGSRQRFRVTRSFVFHEMMDRPSD